MKKITLGIFLIAINILIFVPQHSVFAEDNNLGVRNPNEALRDVFEPVKDSFNRSIAFVVNALEKAWGYIKLAISWLGDLISPITTFIDGLFEKMTGVTISEGFQKIGNFFIYLIDGLANFIKYVISKITLTFKK